MDPLVEFVVEDMGPVSPEQAVHLLMVRPEWAKFCHWDWLLKRVQSGSVSVHSMNCLSAWLLAWRAGPRVSSNLEHLLSFVACSRRPEAKRNLLWMCLKYARCSVDAKHLVNQVIPSQRALWRQKISQLIQHGQDARDQGKARSRASTSLVPLTLSAMQMFSMGWYESVISCWRLLDDVECLEALGEFVAGKEHGRVLLRKLAVVEHPTLGEQAQQVILRVIQEA